MPEEFNKVHFVHCLRRGDRMLECDLSLATTPKTWTSKSSGKRLKVNGLWCLKSKESSSTIYEADVTTCSFTPPTSCRVEKERSEGVELKTLGCGSD